MNRLKQVAALCLLPLLCLIAEGAHAFGANGHRIVAGIAEQHLTKEAKEAVMAITNGHSLASVATWPDEIRSDESWNYAKDWHFLTIEDSDSFEKYEHSEKGDLITALNKFEKVLISKSASEEERWQALAFYVHFVGDIHQPLHVGRGKDRGGNKIGVQWFKASSNLHTVWDSSMLDYQQLSHSEYVNFLDHATKEKIKTWQADPYLEWAQESKDLRETVYDYGDQYYLNVPNLEYLYIFNKKAILEERLLRGGIRAAGKLNVIFAK
jgi:hypothetical protein